MSLCRFVLPLVLCSAWPCTRAERITVNHNAFPVVVLGIKHLNYFPLFPIYMFFLLLCSFEINHVFGYFFDYFCCRFCCCGGIFGLLFCCLTCFTYAMHVLTHPKTIIDHQLLAVPLPTSPLTHVFILGNFPATVTGKSYVFHPGTSLCTCFSCSPTLINPYVSIRTHDNASVTTATHLYPVSSCYFIFAHFAPFPFQ